MLRTRHKSWFGVATADMLITSEHQPLGFGGCSQWAWIDCRNRRCRSGRHEEYQTFETDVVADYDARTAVERELVPCFASHRCCGACVVPPPLRPISFRSRPRF